MTLVSPPGLHLRKIMMRTILKVAAAVLAAWLALTLWMAVLSGVRSGVRALLILGGVFTAGWMLTAARRR